MKTPQVSWDKAEPATISKPNTRFLHEKAVLLAEQLNSESEDGWTYKVRKTSEERAVVEVYDEEHILTGTL